SALDSVYAIHGRIHRSRRGACSESPRQTRSDDKARCSFGPAVAQMLVSQRRSARVRARHVHAMCRHLPPRVQSLASPRSASGSTCASRVIGLLLVLPPAEAGGGRNGGLGQTTGVGKAVKKLTKNKDPLLVEVKEAFRKLMDTWLAQASSEQRAKTCDTEQQAPGVAPASSVDSAGGAVRSAAVPDAATPATAEGPGADTPMDASTAAGALACSSSADNDATEEMAPAALQAEVPPAGTAPTPQAPSPLYSKEEAQTAPSALVAETQASAMPMETKNEASDGRKPLESKESSPYNSPQLGLHEADQHPGTPGAAADYRRSKLTQLEVKDVAAPVEASEPESPASTGDRDRDIAIEILRKELAQHSVTAGDAASTARELERMLLEHVASPDQIPAGGPLGKAYKSKLRAVFNCLKQDNGQLGKQVLAGSLTPAELFSRMMT
ncbi:hypothetical protein CYMTET_46322, partial [Cymbomonas tetramitiformis]